MSVGLVRLKLFLTKKLYLEKGISLFFNEIEIVDLALSCLDHFNMTSPF